MALPIDDQELFNAIPKTGAELTPASAPVTSAPVTSAPEAIRPLEDDAGSVDAVPTPAAPIPSDEDETLDVQLRTKNKEISDNIDGQIAGLEVKKQALIAGTAMGIKQAAAQRVQNAEMQKEAQKRSDDAQLRQESNQKQLLQAEKDYNDAKKDLADEKVDPNRYWNNKNTASKFASILALAIGGFIEGFTEGRVKNQGMVMLNTLIDRDIDAQRADIDIKKQDVGNRNQLFQMMRQRFGDTEEAHIAAKMLAYDKAKLQNDVLVSKSGSAEQRARGVEMATNIDAEKSKLKLEFDKAMVKKLEGQKALQLRRETLGAVREGRAVDTSNLSKEQMDRADRLRGEYGQRTKELGTEEVLSSHGQIKKLGTQDTPAANIGTVYSFMKMLDPGSTVREGEYATAQNAGSIDDKIRNMYNKTIDGTLLTEKQRKDFITQADTIAKNKVERQNILNTKYTMLSRESGVPEKLVIQEFGASKDPNARNIEMFMKNNPGITEEQTIQALKKTGNYRE